MKAAEHFSVSTNILRDAERDIRYIVTPNAQGIYAQIWDNWKKGLHCFTMIGSYGTGKSSFIWALEKQLVKGAPYFKSTSPGTKNKFQFDAIVGSYASLTETFKRRLNLRSHASEEQILAALASRTSRNTTLVIVLDEFGKFLEYAIKNNPEQELYFIQQLAEWANSPKSNVLLLTSLHQNFSAYGRNLPKEQRQEWDKVRGRFYELAFNEPVEQLLFLASQRLKEQFRFNWPQDNAFYDIVNTAHLTAADDIKKGIFNALAPFDYLTAFFLTRSLQRYGQNERSLFTFLETNVELAKCAALQKRFGIRELYTYLIDQYSDTLFSRENPDLAQWTSLRIAIEKTESFISRETVKAIDAVILIGFIGLFGRSAGGGDRKFLTAYLGKANNYSFDNAIADLEKAKIIRFVQYRKRYQLFDGTDLDIEAAIADAEDHVDVPSDFAALLQQELQLPVIFAKQYFLETGTPRFFRYHISLEPITSNPFVDVDGCINIIIGGDGLIKKNDVETISNDCQDLVVHVLYNSPERLRNNLLEIIKLQYVLEKNSDDVVARREILSTLSFEKIRLRTEFLEELFSQARSVHWYTSGERLKADVIRESTLNRHLSQLCHEYFHKTARLHNELINRRELSTPIKTCRRSFIQALIENHNVEDIGFAPDKFPPEKTIYLTLLKEQGIHNQSPEGWTLGNPVSSSSIKPAWDAGLEFLNHSRKGKLSLGLLVQKWKSAPYGIKDGVIQFLLPTFIVANQENFSLFSDNGYIAFINTEVIELLLRKPDGFKVRATDVTGVKLSLFENYRKIMQLDAPHQGRTSLNQAIRPLLALVHGLPDFSKRTHKGLSAPARRLRDAIIAAQEPEATLFETIPSALGYNNLPDPSDDIALQNYLTQFKNAIREISTCFSTQLDQIERSILDTCGMLESSFEKYQPLISRRFTGLIPQKLPADLRLLHARLSAPFDDRNSWISAISHSLVQKRAEQLSDDEVELLLTRIRDSISHLEGYLDIHQLQSEHGAADAAKLRIYSTSLGKPVELSARIDVKESLVVEQLKQSLRATLKGQNPEILKMALIKLLEEQIKHV